VAKHVDAAEVRIVVAAVLAAAANALLVANHLPKPGVYLITARLVEKIDWRQEARGIKKEGGRGAETLPQQVMNNSEAAQQKR
jgi:hypothetical protein